MCVRKAKTRRAFCDIGNCFAPYKAKAYGEAHYGGMELWRKCDPPQTENPACEILYCFI